MTLFLLFALSLLGWRLAPWQEVLWLERAGTLGPGGIERIDPNDPDHQEYYGEVVQEHLAQYALAVNYGREHKLQSVADIASGTCYGMKMLREVVPVVDGYDKEDFCGNYVLDLDKEDWGRQYDAIVSFETIEHLQNPEFFLKNAVRSAPVLLLSTPVNEGPENHFHLQHWTYQELRELLERYYTCQYLHRVGNTYEPDYVEGNDLTAVCTRRTEQAQSRPDSVHSATAE